MIETLLDTKVSLPNKLLQDDGSITDIAGNTILESVPEYDAKASLPNKFLNADGTYSTLNEIFAEVANFDLFIPVDTLPETGDPTKIYLVPNGEGTFDEYHYDVTLNKWDPFGVLDISNLVTTDQLQEALQQAKIYTDQEISKIVPMISMSNYPSIVKYRTTKELFDSIYELGLPVGTILLGTCGLSDLGEIGLNMIREEIKVEVFNAAIQMTMTSTNVEPYEWRLSGMPGPSTEVSVNDWIPSVTQNYVNSQIDEKVTQVLGGEY